MQTPETATNGSQKWMILVAVGIGTFMSALDTSVVNAILPVIRTAFNSQVAAIEWVIVVYLLVVSGLLLTFGRLGDLRGHRRVYLLGFLFFVGGSALCGAAPSAAMLAVFRGFQALGAAMLLSNSPAILTSSFPSSQRGQALGMQATMTYLGLMVGPSLGGLLAQRISWRAVFYINVPISLIGIWLAWRFIPADRPEAREEKFDLAGAGLFLAGLVTLLLGLNQGGDWGWTSPLILGLIAAAAVLLAVFVWVENRSRWPMLDLSLFKRWMFTASAASAVCNYIAIYSLLFLIPFYLIQGRGLDPEQAGLLLTAQPLVMAVTAPISGFLSDRIGARIPSTLGLAILAVGLFLLSRLGPQSPMYMVWSGMAVCGLGTGIFVSPNNSALMGSAPRHRQGIAAGTMATARNVGMVLGIGISGAFLSTHLAGSAASNEGIFHAVHYGYLTDAAICLLGAVLSAARGKKPVSGL